jgi:hypothetical protein
LGERSPGDGDVVGSGVRTRVALAQQERQRLSGPCLAVVGKGEQRVEPEPAFERRRRVFLIRMRGQQRGIEVDDQRIINAGSVIRCMVASLRPHPGPHRSARGVDRGERFGCVGGESVDQP